MGSCRCGNTSLGKLSSVTKCASAARAKGLRKFMFGTSTKRFSVYRTGTGRKAKPKAVPMFEKVKANHKCKSRKVNFGKHASVDSCAAAVHHKNKNKSNIFFIFGTGRKRGYCYQEMTRSSSCREGWRKTPNYQFYSVLGKALSCRNRKFKDRKNSRRMKLGTYCVDMSSYTAARNGHVLKQNALNSCRKWRSGGGGFYLSKHTCKHSIKARDRARRAAKAKAAALRAKKAAEKAKKKAVEKRSKEKRAKNAAMKMKEKAAKKVKADKAKLAAAKAKAAERRSKQKQAAEYAAKKLTKMKEKKGKPRKRKEKALKAGKSAERAKKKLLQAKRSEKAAKKVRKAKEKALKMKLEHARKMREKAIKVGSAAKSERTQKLALKMREKAGKKIRAD